MSCMESKFALRAKIKELNGASNLEAYNYFVKKLGKPSDIDEWEGKVEYFVYNEEDFDIIPVKDYSTKNWAVDYLLQYTYNGTMIKGSGEFTINELLDAMKQLEFMFKVPMSDISIVNYEWYNGGDEPVHIK